jgi:hypothetical protein
MVTPAGDIICDTANEALSLQRAILNQGHKQGRSHVQCISEPISSSSRNDDFRKMLDLLKGRENQKNLLTILYNESEGCLDFQLVKRLNLKNTMALSGVRTAIVRKMKRVRELVNDDIIIAIWDKDKKETRFSLSQSFRKMLSNVGGIQ